MPEIRPKIRIKHVQRAQGMVEFALVLPLLLLLILGVFAFGHLFFVYTSVVSASREAARWGSAVGEAPSSFPRYEDCASIRDQAVRLGSFAGVNATDIDDANSKDTGVDISYDHGPNADGTSSPYTTCPAVGTGPTDVQMGDRIIVRVKVNYTPIVPVVNLPSFPLEATTYRTILKSVPVGKAPTAVDPCTTDTTIKVTADNEPSVVGQQVSYTISVSADDPKYDGLVEGDVTLHSLPGEPDTYSCSGTMADGTFVCPNTIAYPTAGIKKLEAVFHVNEQSNACLTDSQPVEYQHEVVKADTNIQLGVSSPQQVNVSMTVSVAVQAVFPGGGTPTGKVLLTWKDPNDPKTQTVALGNGSGSWIFAPTHPGTYVLRADYPDPAYPDPNYNASFAEMYVTVLSATITPGNTVAPTVTLVQGTPAKTPLPPYCPRLEPSNYDIFQVGSALQLPIYNPDVTGSTNTNVASVDITWPVDPAARLQEIRLGPNVDACVTSGNQNNRNCLWRNSAGLDPTHQVITSSSAGWNGSYAGINKGTTELMRLVFNHSLPQGSYLLVIRFTNNNCQIEISKDKVTP